MIWRGYPTEESRSNHGAERKTEDGKRTRRLNLKKTKAKVEEARDACGGSWQKEGSLGQNSSLFEMQKTAGACPSAHCPAWKKTSVGAYHKK